MREVWGRVVRLLAADDPETGRLVRLLMSLVLAWSLAVASPDRAPALVWSALGGSMACWLAFVLLDGRFPRVAVALLGAGSAIAASVSGSAEAATTVFVFALLLQFAVHVVPSLGAIVAVTALDVGLMAGSMLGWDQPRSAIVIHGAVVLCTVLFALHRRQYRRAQQDRARAMALDERARIARELHDVLAHSLGALGVQLEVAEAMLTERGDVEGAVARIRRSRALAREGLVEARSAVAALREDVPPLPDALSLLVAEHRRDHDVPAELRATGTRRPITPAAEVCLLRTAREALTNAARHAPGEPVSVGLGYGDGAVRLVVRNPCPAVPSGPDSRVTPPSGHGLQGMRERLALAGGTLLAGQVGDLWEVRAEVPE
ncbi:Histidine kinase [Nonomuraea maritima]|uniref:histidine kinase n=1 Tax=Nonomuraea maritima TaxID=683260 RepID=A0A1G9R9G5_9ACTN|nr:histidine kinase [Nonomuraea maritima]SDM19854.1 Histidine kinase [Nonomuraea maritima]